jgi:hypothetical protein
MSRTSGLSAWLATLHSAQLHALLRRRPDAALPPEPRDLAALAERLNSGRSIMLATELLQLPALQVAEAVLALGGSTARPTLLAMLGCAEDEAGATRVDAALDELLGLALVWPVDAEVRMSGAWREVLPDPLGVGRSGQQLYPRLTVPELARIGSGYGLGGYQRTQEWVDALVRTLGDPDVVARKLAQAPPDLAELVTRTAWHGPRLAMVGVHFPSASRPVRPEELGPQLVVQGWVVPTGWGSGEMPSEVALAVRGPGYHAPFTGAPPAPATAPIEPSRVAEAGRHAAGNAVEGVRRLLALLDRVPPATLRAGGIGVRELRRVAKQLDTDEPTVRVWLETAAAAGLIAATSTAVLATTDAEPWLTAEGAESLSTLLLAWWRLAMVPSHRIDEDGKALPALLHWFLGGAEDRLRIDAFDELAAFAGDRGLVELDELAARLRHRRPIRTGGPDLGARLAATVREAAALGLVADGALTPIGRGLLAAARTDDPAGALRAMLAGVLPATRHTATFLPDLTVLVTGSAGVPLSRLLDGVAESERRDTASTWRFTADSVRRALDAGRTADDLLSELAEVADNPLPQPLEYLVRDVARRHGQVQVFPVACCVRVADAALAAELLAHRGLAELRLRALAGTVLAGSATVADTVAALHKAGYAPIRQNAQGETVVERMQLRRVDLGQARAQYPSFAGVSPPDLAALARRLAGAGST